jgi:hypothetical protein
LKDVSKDIYLFTRKINLVKGTKQEKLEFGKVTDLNILRKNLETDDIIFVEGIPQKDMLLGDDLITNLYPKSHLEKKLAIQSAKNLEVVPACDFTNE